MDVKNIMLVFLAWVGLQILGLERDCLRFFWARLYGKQLTDKFDSYETLIAFHEGISFTVKSQANDNNGGILVLTLKTEIEDAGYMWCFAQFGTICTIWKTWKAPVEECYF